MTRLRLVLAAAATGLLVTTGVQASDASWSLRQVAGGSLGAASSACTASGLYSTVSDSRMVSGSVLGGSLDPVAAVGGLHAAHTGTVAAVTPSTSASVGAEAWKAPLSASAVDGAIATAIGATLPLAWANGAYTQYGSVHSDGRSIAAVGAVTDGGQLDTGGIAAGTAASVGTLDVSSALQPGAHTGSLPGLSALTVSIGAIAARLSLNGCVQSWRTGAAPSDGAYSLSSLGLDLHDAALTQLGSTATTASSSVLGRLTTLTGATGVVSPTEAALATTAGTGLGQAVTDALAALPVASRLVGATVQTTSTATVSAATSPDDVAAVAAVMTEHATDPSGLVTVAFGDGSLHVDAGVLAALNGRPANSPVLDGAAIGSIASAVGAVLTAHAQRLAAAWTALRDDTQVTVAATSTVTAAGLTAATVALSTTAPLKQYLAGTEPRPAPTVTAASTLASGLTTALAGSTTADYYRPVSSAVTTGTATPFTTAITNATSSVTSAVGTAQTAAAAQLAPLPGVLQMTVNSQPSQPPYPPSPFGSGAGRLSMTALRIRVQAAATPDLDLFLGSIAVGPNRPVSR